ncbi:MAG: DegQ family serine endoprotease [Pseudomonadota bacterium]
MRTLFSRAGAVAVLTAGLVTSANAALPLVVDGQPLPSLAPLIKEVAPAVVNIQVTATRPRSSRFADDPLSRRFFGIPEAPRERQVQGQGSGVIVDAANGYIVTNHHVVQNAVEIQVTLLDDRVLDAEIIGSDPGTDVAVLKVDGSDLTEIPFGDSDVAEVGDFVIAIGNPFGLTHTVTSGIISAQGRSGIGDREAYEDFIQTDASINPGNSGGALVNLRGELIGVNSAILSRSGGNIGIGFAIPSEITQSVMRQLVEFGEVRRGLLGVQIGTIERDQAKEFGLTTGGGALITEVSPGSAAEKAGLQLEDIIIGVDDKTITDANELRNAIGLMAAGEVVRIRIVRDGRTRTVRATLGERSETAAAAGTTIHPGLDGAEFATADEGGVEITSVAEGSRAAAWQLAPGDIILKVNQRTVTSVAELTEAASGQRVLWVLIQRGNTRFIRQIR